MKNEKFSTILSQRERDVVDALLQGMSNKQIALSLGISERTVEFHLNNVYTKLRVGSRVELILKLGRSKDGVLANPVESTVDLSVENPDNGNQPTQSRWAQSLRNTVSLIKKEVAMTIRISFEDLENALKSKPFLFGLLVLLTASLAFRYVVFDIGLYFWFSYVLLELLLILGSVRFGELLNGNMQFRPLVLILIAALLPLIVAGFDQLYLNTILRYVDPISFSIPNLSATAGWLRSPDGVAYLSTQLNVTSDVLWFIAIAEMLVMFMLSRVFGKHSGKDNLVTV